MIDEGAALVLGHGPHVPRAMEIYRGRLIAYSLGNFATYRMFNLMGFNGTGPILEVELGRKGQFIAGRILPIRQRGAGVPAPDAEATATDLLRWLSAEDFPETGVAIDTEGRIRAPTRAERRARLRALAGK
jgi:hypothetical protein